MFSRSRRARLDRAARRGAGHRTRRHRTGPSCGDGACGSGRRRGARSPLRRPDHAGRRPRPAAPRKTDGGPRRQNRSAVTARVGRQGRRAAGLLSARRHRAAVLRGIARRTGLVARRCSRQFEIGLYPKMFEVFTERFAGKTRVEWAEIFAGTDACVTPVLSWSEAAGDPHLTARATVINANGVDQAAPAPRFSRTPAGPVGTPPPAATPLDEIDW